MCVERHPLFLFIFIFILIRKQNETIQKSCLEVVIWRGRFALRGLISLPVTVEASKRELKKSELFGETETTLTRKK